MHFPSRMQVACSAVAEIGLLAASAHARPYSRAPLRACVIADGSAGTIQRAEIQRLRVSMQR